MEINRYDTFWPRLIALIVDGFIINAAIGFVTFFLAAAHVDASDANQTLFVLKNNLPYLYAIAMVAQSGQTLGKMVMRIKIVDHDTGEEIGFSQSFKREAIPFVLVNVSIFSWFFIFYDIDIRNDELSFFGWIVLFLPSFMLLIWSLLEIITMLLDSKSRALHDKLADTVVIRLYPKPLG
jgi:uncharacterized RDD family membrane protein YckC